MVVFPGFAAIITHVNNVIISVTASASGDTVTAIEHFEGCFARSLQVSSVATKDCIAGPQSSFTSVNTVLAGVYVLIFRSIRPFIDNLCSHFSLQQFVGYLPPNIIQDVQNSALLHSISSRRIFS